MPIVQIASSKWRRRHSFLPPEQYQRGPLLENPLEACYSPVHESASISSPYDVLLPFPMQHDSLCPSSPLIHARNQT